MCENIRTLRLREHLTIENMAQRLGIDREQLQKLEDGILPEAMTVEMLVRLEKEFDVSLKEIFLPL